VTEYDFNCYTKPISILKINLRQYKIIKIELKEKKYEKILMEMNIHNTVGNHIIDLSSFYKKRSPEVYLHILNK